MVLKSTSLNDVIINVLQNKLSCTYTISPILSCTYTTREVIFIRVAAIRFHYVRNKKVIILNYMLITSIVFFTEDRMFCIRILTTLSEGFSPVIPRYPLEPPDGLISTRSCCVPLTVNVDQAGCTFALLSVGRRKAGQASRAGRPKLICIEAMTDSYNRTFIQWVLSFEQSLYKTPPTTAPRKPPQ